MVVWLGQQGSAESSAKGKVAGMCWSWSKDGSDIFLSDLCCSILNQKDRAARDTSFKGAGQKDRSSRKEARKPRRWETMTMPMAGIK